MKRGSARYSQGQSGQKETGVDNLTKELPVIEIKDQCRTGTCWINSFATTAEYMILANHGKKIPISIDYLASQHLITQATEGIRTGKNFHIREGGNAPQAIELIAKVGLVPSDCEWKARVPLKQWERKEEKASEPTVELNKVADDWYKLLRHHAPTEAEKREFLLRIKAISDKYVGSIPEVFTYQGTKYTPQEFARTFFFDKTLNITVIVPFESSYALSKSNLNKSSLKREAEKNGVRFKEKSFSDIEKELKSSIDNGKSIELGMVWVPDMVNAKAGKITYDNSLPSSQELLFMGKHAVTIVGYLLDSSGHITHLKIQNSYGAEDGSGGRYQVDIEYFRKFMLYLQTVDQGN